MVFPAGQDGVGQLPFKNVIAIVVQTGLETRDRRELGTGFTQMACLSARRLKLRSTMTGSRAAMAQIARVQGGDAEAFCMRALHQVHGKRRDQLEAGG